MYSAITGSHATHYLAAASTARTSALCSCVNMAHKKMADAAVAKSERDVPRESAIPTEVIHGIVSYLVASFLDDLFEGPLALSVDIDSQIVKDGVSSFVNTVQRVAHEF